MPITIFFTGDTPVGVVHKRGFVHVGIVLRTASQ